jgi:catechol 2,3-dioxygenase-like lactoylglutathione lyase family enzyme
MNNHIVPRVSIGHISLEVSDLSRSRKFYESALKGLGFRTVLEQDDAFGCSNESLSIFLAKTQTPRVQRKPPAETEFVIAEHFAILLPDKRIVDETAELMKNAGFKPFFPPEEHPEFVPGYYSASFCDPDNNVIEFYTIEERK